MPPRFTEDICGSIPSSPTPKHRVQGKYTGCTPDVQGVFRCSPGEHPVYTPCIRLPGGYGGAWNELDCANARVTLAGGGLWLPNQNSAGVSNNWTVWCGSGVSDGQGRLLGYWRGARRRTGRAVEGVGSFGLLHPRCIGWNLLRLLAVYNTLATARTIVAEPGWRGTA